MIGYFFRKTLQTINYDPLSPYPLGLNMRDSLDTMMDSNILPGKLSERSQNRQAYRPK